MISALLARGVFSSNFVWLGGRRARLGTR